MKYYCDCFVIKTNPSPFGGGYTVVDENSNIVCRKEITKFGFTNNEGEILGIMMALEISSEGDTVSTDSTICKKWASFGNAGSRSDLYGVASRCQELIVQKNIKLIWEKRDKNLAGIHNDSRLGKEQKRHFPEPWWVKDKMMMHKKGRTQKSYRSFKYSK